MGRIKTWLLGFLGELGKFLKALFERGVMSELNALLPMALEVVREVETTGLDGKEKRERAFSILKRKLIRAQWQVATSVINFAIELAVQRLKAETAKR